MKKLTFKEGDLVLVTLPAQRGKAIVTNPNPERYKDDPKQVVEVNFVRTGVQSYFYAQYLQPILTLPPQKELPKSVEELPQQKTNADRYIDRVPDNGAGLITGYNDNALEGF